MRIGRKKDGRLFKAYGWNSFQMSAAEFAQFAKIMAAIKTQRELGLEPF